MVGLVSEQKFHMVYIFQTLQSSNFHSYMYMKMTKYTLYIFNSRHTMYSVHKVTFVYLRILPNSTIQESIYLST